MTEKKLKPAAKKATPSNIRTSTKKSGAVSSKSKTAKTTVATAATKAVAKKAAPKKPSVVAAKNTSATALKKAASPAPEKKAPARKAPVAKVAASNAGGAPGEKAIAYPTPEERYRMVETAAYFIAEQHGFQGRSDEHWAAAEREIAAKLGSIQH